MSELTAQGLAQKAFELHLINEHELADLHAHFGRRQLPVEEFNRYVLRAKLLTNWQLERLAKDDDGESVFFCGPYKLLYLAGTGTFSRVYRAIHKDTGELFAVKLLRRRWSERPDNVEQFVREGRMGLNLRHENVVSVFDVFSKGSFHYFSMEFVEGQNLRDFTKLRKKFEPVAATQLMIGVLNGLSYAFQKGICHRDLKLTNVLVSSQGVPKLVDFGLAGGEKTDKRTVVDGADVPNPRTVDYVGLERASGVKRDDQRSDIFFAGCIYYHLLCGKAPLVETRDRIQRLSKNRYTEITPILKLEPNLPRPVVAVVARAMELNATLRYQTPAEMLAELHAVLRRLTDPAQATTPSVAEVASAADDSFSVGPAQPEAVQKTVMIVESNPQMQESLRNGIKKWGYRALLTRDPNYAWSRFENAPAADCVVFSTLELGEAALQMFNQFGTTEGTAKTPVLLLLGEGQNALANRARAGELRIILQSPIKNREFRAALQQLAPLPQNLAPPA